MSQSAPESDTDSRITPEFDESRDSEERATAVVEREGLPEDNPFADVVRDLRDDGKSWTEIYDALSPVEVVVDKAAYEEGFELLPEWKVAAVVPDENATSGERYEYHERLAETAQQAEQEVEQATGFRVEPEETEQVGTGKVS